MHRVHALALAVDRRAMLVLLPMGGGKSTLGAELLRHPDVQLLSDDSPLVDRAGRVHAFPLRLGLLPGHEKDDSGGVSTHGAAIGARPENRRELRLFPGPCRGASRARSPQNPVRRLQQAAVEAGSQLSHDQPGVAARIERTGTGVRVPTGACDAAALRSAVERVLADASFRRKAQSFKRLIAERRGLANAADIIEQVLTTGSPVLRRQA